MSKNLNHEAVLQKLAREIDVLPEVYEVVVARYQSLSEWLDREASTLAAYDPYVAPQGSFLLGTANRPIEDTDDIDVDLICRLLLSKSQMSQKQLKESVGVEVLAYASAHNMQEEAENGRRCWTLRYADQRNFHVDILPCIPDAERYAKRLQESGFSDLAGNKRITEQAIAITDKYDPAYEDISDNWPTSNPLGYAEWFRERMAERLAFAKRVMLSESTIYERVEDIPDQAVKTTLQKAIQLLKRHRDTMFGEDPEHKPISIIITTLAAHAYNNEHTLVEALSSILQNMDRYIETVDGVRWVANPVNPNENFADKWAETPIKETNFRRWLSAARQEFGMYIRGSSPTDLPTILEERLGEATVERVRKSFPEKKSGSPSALAAPTIVSRASDMTERVKQRNTQTAPWCSS